MNVSIDLLIEQVSEENGAGEWLRIDEEFRRVVNAQTRELASIVHGRVFYELMEGFWPAAQADVSLPQYEREYGEIWTAKPKILVSRTRQTTDYNTRTIGGDDAIDRLADFRASTDGRIAVGSATLATQLLRAGLLDELQLLIHPVFLGFGRPLFDEYELPIDLELIEHRAFASGVVMNRYAILSPGAAAHESRTEAE